MKLNLVRVAQDKEATLGVLVIDGRPRMVTLERPWLDNAKEVSCVPAGEYKVKPIQSPRFGATWEVMNVPNRSNILFHKGNTADDSKGCILVGLQYGTETGIPVIAQSGTAFGVLHRFLEGHSEIDLSIKECV